MQDIVDTVWRLIKEKSSVRRVSIELGMDRASLYRSLKRGTNPRIDTVMKFLDHLGYRLQVVRIVKRERKIPGRSRGRASKKQRK
jgi:DNA-binding phage protein